MPLAENWPFKQGSVRTGKNNTIKQSLTSLRK